MSFFIYNLLLWFFSPFLFLFFIYRTWKRNESLTGLRERLGFHRFATKNVHSSTVWIHAVSVGEVKIADTVTKTILNSNPELRIYVSTVTQTGRSEALKILGVEKVFYLPFDFISSVKRILRSISPDILVIIETEIWPNLIKQTRKDGCPVFIVNARLSDRSFCRYNSFRFFFNPIFQLLTKVVARGEKDAEYFFHLGASDVIVSGDLKYDSINDPPVYKKNSVDFRVSSIFSLKNIILAGSTHEGEEEMIVDSFVKLRRKFSKINLIIAPRHLNRIKSIEEKIRKMDQNSILWSSISQPFPEDGQIIILDVMGELSKLYSCAVFAFVGGSLVKHGGQNPIEVAVCGIPVIFGPHMYNFNQVANLLLDRGAAFEVEDGDGLERVMNKLLSDEVLRKKVGSSAYKLIIEKRGSSSLASDLIMTAIQSSEVRKIE